MKPAKLNPLGLVILLLLVAFVFVCWFLASCAGYDVDIDLPRFGQY